MILKVFYILALTLAFPRLVLSQCHNVINPGLICCNQTICAGERPDPITESQAPTGGSGNLEYDWHQLRPGPDGMPQWDIIAGETSSAYQPDTLYETSYFLRDVRREGCMEYRASNVMIITVLPPNDPACAPSAVAQPDDLLATVRVSPNPFQAQFAAYNGAAQAVRLQVFNAVGVLMAELRLPAGQETNVDSKDWSTGVYVIRMEGSDGGKRTLPVVKM